MAGHPTYASYVYTPIYWCECQEPVPAKVTCCPWHRRCRLGHQRDLCIVGPPEHRGDLVDNDRECYLSHDADRSSKVTGLEVGGASTINSVDRQSGFAMREARHAQTGAWS